MATYKAVRLSKLGGSIEEGIASLTMESLPLPKLKSDQVRVQIYTSCLNYFDLLMLIGRYQYKPKLPTTLGAECAGIVIEAGSDVTSLKVGDRVFAAMSFSGCHAEQLVDAASAFYLVPSGLSLRAAAAIGVGFFTAYHAIVHRGHFKPTDKVLITGAGGGMGLSAIQVARALGCQCVIAACSSATKGAIAQKYGAHHVVLYGNSNSNSNSNNNDKKKAGEGKSKNKAAENDWKKQVDAVTNGEGVDLVYEVVGGSVFRTAFRCVSPNGRLLVVGFASGDIPNVGANLVLVKGVDVVGVRSGAEMMRRPDLVDDMIKALHRLVDAGQKGETTSILPHVTMYPPHDFQRAYTDLNQATMLGKAALIWKEEEIKAKL